MRHPIRSVRARTAALTLLLVASSTPLAAQRSAGGTAVAEALDDRIDRVVERAPYDRAHWGIYVLDPLTGSELYARNAGKLFIPASNLKLVVAGAAAHYLPDDYRIRTTLLATGPVQDGVLEGDLVVYGRGDPTISGRFFDDRMTAVWESLADSLAARGVTRVAGAVVADESWLDTLHVHPDWESYDLLWWYAAPVGALGFNDNSIDFRIRPAESLGRPAQISWQPESDAVVLLNRTRTVASGGRTLDFARVGASDTVLAYGEVPLDARPWTEYFAVRDPASYAATVLRETLERRGIAVADDRARVLRSVDESVLSRAGQPVGGATVLAEWRSPPLRDLVGPILLNSQNWFAEQMLKVIGRERGQSGSWDEGLRLERKYLTDVVGIPDSDFRLRDASGLSAGNLITPRALAKLLVHVRSDPVVADAMPVSAAERGSLRYRFTDLPGRVRAKTGGIRNVDSLSGFVRTDGGRELVFVVIANGTAFPDARAAIDDVVRAIAAEEGGS